MKILPGTKAMVTGAASGIGRCIALALAKESVDLCLIDIDEKNLQMAAQEAKSRGVEVLTKVCDLSQSSEIRNTVDFLFEPGTTLISSSTARASAIMAQPMPWTTRNGTAYYRLICRLPFNRARVTPDFNCTERGAHRQRLQPLRSGNVAPGRGLPDEQVWPRWI